MTDFEDQTHSPSLLLERGIKKGLPKPTYTTKASIRPHLHLLL